MRIADRPEPRLEASATSPSSDGSARDRLRLRVSVLSAFMVMVVGLVTGAQAASTEHLIVTADGLVTQAEQLRDHRIRTGMSSRVVTMTEVSAAYPSPVGRAVACRL